MDLATVRLIPAGRQAEEGRLARPVRADETDPVSERDRRVDRIEDDERAALSRVTR